MAHELRGTEYMLRLSMLVILALAFVRPAMWGTPITEFVMAPRHDGRLAASGPAWRFECHLAVDAHALPVEGNPGDASLPFLGEEAILIREASIDAAMQEGAADLAIAGSEETPQSRLVVSISILILLGALLKCITSARFYEFVSDVSYTVFTIENEGRDDSK